MKLLNILKTFRNDEDGAVTVDWVVLTAAIVALGIAVMSVVGPAITGQATALSTKIGNASTSING